MARRFTLLLAEGHAAQRRRLADRLADDGYTVRQAGSHKEATQQLTAACPDALIAADIGPPVSAPTLIAAIRAGKVTLEVRHLPVIVLSGKTDQRALLLRCFEAGADDFQPRGVPYDELRARLAALLERAYARATPPRTRRVGALVVHLDACAAFWDGQPISLSKLEFALLAQLATAPTRVQSKAELLRDVWGFRAPSKTRTVDAYVSRLRAKLAAVGADGWVVTRHGLGYQLVDTDSADAVGPPTAAQP